MNLEVHVRICEGIGGKFPGATRLVAFCESKEDAAEVIHILQEWLKERGLELSPEKTQISHLSVGFDFLGFTIRHYKSRNTRTGWKLLITPSKVSVQECFRSDP